ncbi:M2 family metallopeptidase [Chitinophaga sp. LS1]|uniref:M2 family metallopeptidase n=1 Tax=Chitinophaga sp. LS1 TaxID=3051176 RepID=UPI002AAC4B46|nr:M2 family metallopeptidase [Chitinophaga sp. LS1]WPV63962.1 M2 family metallopeptidase [Chitinophaga sp. LS1]
MNRITLVATGALLSFAACQSTDKNNHQLVQLQAQTYLDGYNKQFQDLIYKDNLAQWTLNTRIVKGDTVSQQLADAADKVLAEYTGSKANIDSAQKYLQLKEQLTPLQIRQFEVILFNAGNNPATAGDIVTRRISATNKQLSALYGFKFTLDGKPVTTGRIDEILESSNNLQERRKAWTASKEVGKTLKNGLDSLQFLRNASVTPLGYKDFFDYNAREYGMSEDEMIKLTRQFVTEIWPLYRELHTWARYTLAEKYKQPVPDYIPADWLPNRWGQDWSSLVDVKGLSIDSILKVHGAEWMAHQSEDFYKSLGFDALPPVFWEKSSLYPVPADSPFTKNNHASAWHMDLDKDVRSLESITPTTDYWSTVLHEFGHIYYYMSYSRPEIPVILRGGANRGFHEAFGTMMGLASLQKPFLENLNLIPKNTTTNDTLKLLKEALSYVVSLPWSSGVMTEFEYNLYAKKLPKDQYNQAWWKLVKQFQGIVPPTERGEEYCDAATKTHINDDPAQYYDYSIASVLVFQFHAYIADNILHQDPHATNYWGNKAVGDFLKKVMSPGASIDWRQQLKDDLHTDMSAKPMVAYFSVLMDYLKKANTGKKYTLPAQPVFE